MNRRRLSAVLVVVAVVAFAVWLLWPYLVGAAVVAAAWRVMRRGTTRRRPKSSWSSLGRTGALMFAAWNSRWLKPAEPRASVLAEAGRRSGYGPDADELERVPF